MDREQLSQILNDMIAPYIDDDRMHVFFQSPASYRMTYPAIIYRFDGFDPLHANNKKYKLFRKYSILLIASDPELPLIEEIVKLPYCHLDRTYTADNLYHYSYTISC